MKRSSEHHFLYIPPRFAVGILSVFFFLNFIIFSSTDGFCLREKPSLLLEGSSLQEKEGLLILHLKGTPYQMGYQHVVLLKPQIKTVYEDYLLHRLQVKTKTAARYYSALTFFKSKEM